MVEWIQENTKEILGVLGTVIVGIVGLIIKNSTFAHRKKT